MESLINKSNYYFLSFLFICHWRIVLQERFEADTHVSFTSQKDEKERITKAGGREISRREGERERERRKGRNREKERIYVWENPWKVTMGERRRWMSRLPEYKHNVCILPIQLKFNLKNAKNSKEKRMSTWLLESIGETSRTFWLWVVNQQSVVVEKRPSSWLRLTISTFQVRERKHETIASREKDRERERKKWYLNAGRWPTSLHSSPVIFFYFQKLSRIVIFFE